jgi:hypothetical protein
MNEIKITAKKDSNERVYIEGLLWTTCLRFTSQETDNNGTPKYKILIPYEHPELEKQEKIDVGATINNRWFGGSYCYEISFVDSEDLLYKHDNYGDKSKRVFSLEKQITIKDNSYEKILEDLKNENNLMKEEETI